MKSNEIEKDIQQKRTKYDIYMIFTIVLVVVYVISIIPVLMIGRYDFPSADDYGFSAYAHVAWHNTGNVLLAIGGAARTAYERFFQWQGTYSSIFLMALQPGIWGIHGYTLTVYIMVGMMTFSTMYFLYVVLVSWLGIEKKIWLALSSIVLLMCIECMPDKTQGLYWFNGAAHYNLGRCEALILLGIIILLLKKNEKKISRIIIATLLSFWLGGSNLITALIVEMIFFCVLVYLLIRDRKSVVLITLPVLFLTLGFVLNIIAPGNSIRAEEVQKTYGPVMAILLSGTNCIKCFATKWGSWEWITYVALIFPFARKAAKEVCDKKILSFKHPILALIGGFAFVSAMFTPTLFAEGDIGAGRLHNIIFMDGVLWILFEVFYLCGFYFLKHSEAKESRFESLVSMYMLVVCIVTLMISGLFTYLASNRFATSCAMEIIASGEGAFYRGQQLIQQEILSAHEGDENADVLLPEITMHPYMLFYESFSSDPDDWKNQTALRYFRVKSISEIK